MKLDCGDNSCFFVEKPTGMRTNGGCRCFESAGFDRSVISSAKKMLPEIIALRASIVDMERKLGVAKGALEKSTGTYSDPLVERERAMMVRRALAEIEKEMKR